MTRFEIKDTFLLDGKPFHILSGAIHYFRVHPKDWYHSLYNLKALGFNTVETYVPWNLHEPKKNEYHFDNGLDIEKFLTLAQEIGLYAIVRPSPYICAEWEFGGFPAWLLEESIRIRSSDERYLQYVSNYYDTLLSKLVPHQLDNGGNILMCQIENEYGSYGEDKEYLRGIKQLMREKGITVPLFTSDGAWRATLRAGSMIEDDILPTGNFGSKADENFGNLKAFFEEYGKTFPLMCMEFWDGWFNRWNEPVIRRDPEELAQAVYDVMKQASINLYMFHGGTNFGFMNGCSARGRKDLPQVTSYDYDALLDEQGNPTAKYMAVSKMLKEKFPHLVQKAPLVKETMAICDIPLESKVSLFNTLHSIADPIYAKYPKTMEALGQNVGYTLYRTKLEQDAQEERYRVIDASDRIQFYLNGKHIVTQYQFDVGEDILTNVPEKENQIDILVENMGRVNYGHKLLADTQHKGIRTGVTADLHFLTNWEHYTLPLDNVTDVDFSKEWVENQPAFYKYSVEIEDPLDTFVDMTGFGKGAVFINGYHIGRFWEVGPIMSLYAPSGVWKQGKNDIVVFETEGVYQSNICLSHQPIIKN
ncbi:beta-galactosidase [Granulicatella sp. zg-ZJ]|uniref:glycoside hydrolase family 35 protein n=1 Tax=Granulicatella sp. zg-ZJ TaxID=2678504 RepID=UPI0013D8129C|nr:beta-galactosidase family protein [Granulicatella sp. zg-ZJ]NEW62025.1 beta-galactosidase [Granulicatella sp. zg-ZJ]